MNDKTLVAYAPLEVEASIKFKFSIFKPRTWRPKTINLRPYDLKAEAWVASFFESKNGKGDGGQIFTDLLNSPNNIVDDTAVDGVYAVVYHLLTDKTGFTSPGDFRRAFKRSKSLREVIAFGKFKDILKRPRVRSTRLDKFFFELLGLSIARSQQMQEAGEYGPTKKKDL